MVWKRLKEVGVGKTMGRYEINSRPFVPPTRWCSWLVSLFQSPSESSSLGQLPPLKSFCSIQLVSHRCHSGAEQSTVDAQCCFSLIVFKFNSQFNSVIWHGVWHNLCPSRYVVCTIRRQTLTQRNNNKVTHLSSPFFYFLYHIPAGLNYHKNFLFLLATTANSGDRPPFRHLPYVALIYGM